MTMAQSDGVSEFVNMCDPGIVSHCRRTVLQPVVAKPDVAAVGPLIEAREIGDARGGQICSVEQIGLADCNV